MIAKNGQYILSKWKNKDLQETSGILIPNSSKENQQFMLFKDLGLIIAVPVMFQLAML